MEQPLNPESSEQQRLESALSRVKAWKFIVVVVVPLVAWHVIQKGLGVSPAVNYQVRLVISSAAVLGWWLAVVPRPYSCSLRATMGRSLTLSDCKLAMVAALGSSSLGYLVAIKFWILLRTASSGGVYTANFTGRDPHAVVLVLSVVVAPVVEELVFRGALFRGWRARWSPVVALLVSSAFFGLFHPRHGAAAFVGGATFALLYARTRSLWASVLAHGLHNATVFALGCLRYFWPSWRLVLDGPVAYGAFALAALLCVGVWLHFVIRSWRTLGAQISPDAPEAADEASPAATAEALHVGSQRH